MDIIPKVEIKTLLEKGLSNYSLIDVRSPSEYLEDHIPGACSIPILSDEERCEIGTIYKKQGPDVARLRGVEIVSPKLPDFIKKVKEISELKKQVVIYCWRGGLRSEASVCFSMLAGIYCFKLTGGYKSFRRVVVDFLEQFDSKRFIVLYGPTGSGKTHILQILKKRGYPVLDLEGGACHKGSVFGHIGEPGYDTVTQKRFETEIFYTLHSRHEKVFFVEGESMKIGKVSIPKSIYGLMKNGVSVQMNSSLDFRVNYSLGVYNPDQFKGDIRDALNRIRRYIPLEKMATLKKLLEEENFRDFCKELMVLYYDPLYAKGLPKSMDFTVEYDDFECAADELVKIYSSVDL